MGAIWVRVGRQVVDGNVDDRCRLGGPSTAWELRNFSRLTFAVAWYVADRTNLIEQLKPGERRYTVLRLPTQSGFSLLGVACAFAYLWLALTIFVATPVVYALTYGPSTGALS